MKNLVLDNKIGHDILLKNLKREFSTFSKNACFSNAAWRFRKETIPDKKNIRQSFFHDVLSTMIGILIDTVNSFF